MVSVGNCASLKSDIIVVAKNGFWDVESIESVGEFAFTRCYSDSCVDYSFPDDHKKTKDDDLDTTASVCTDLDTIASASSVCSSPRSSPVSARWSDLGEMQAQRQLPTPCLPPGNFAARWSDLGEMQAEMQLPTPCLPPGNFACAPTALNYPMTSFLSVCPQAQVQVEVQAAPQMNMQMDVQAALLARKAALGDTVALLSQASLRAAHKAQQAERRSRGKAPVKA